MSVNFERDLKAILDINQKMNSLKDLKTILLDISNYASNLLQSEGASILLVEEESGDLHFEVAFGENSEALYDLRVPKGKGIAGKVAEKGIPIITNDAQTDENHYDGIDEKVKQVTRSLIAAPLKHQEKVIGVIEVINTAKPGGFTEDDADLLIQFGEQAALAITNAMLYTEVQDRATELECLYQISHLTSTTLDREKLFQEIVEVLSNAFSSKRVSIMFVDDESGKLKLECAVGIPEEVHHQIHNSLHEERISSRVATTGKPIATNEIQSSGFGRNKRLRYNRDAFVCVPIKVKNLPIGVINVSEPVEGVVYDNSAIRMLQTVANQVGSARESNRNYKEHIEHEKIKRELEVMRMLQQAILTTNFKDYANLSMFAKMIPAKSVGGDFYEIFALSETKAGFVVGDVSGKGLPASLFMAISRSVVKAYSIQTEDPGKLMEYTNRIMCEDSRVGMFVTMFYCILDLETGEITYANAGHNQQYVYRPSNDEFYPLSVRGIPVGINSGESYDSLSFHMSAGDTLFCFTDGVTEAVNSEGSQYGMERLKAVVRNFSNMQAATLVNAIIRDVNEWAEEVPQWDDITVLAFKLT